MSFFTKIKIPASALFALGIILGFAVTAWGAVYAVPYGVLFTAVRVGSITIPPNFECTVDGHNIQQQLP